MPELLHSAFHAVLEGGWKKEKEGKGRRGKGEEVHWNLRQHASQLFIALLISPVFHLLMQWRSVKCLLREDLEFMSQTIGLRSIWEHWKASWGGYKNTAFPNIPQRWDLFWTPIEQSPRITFHRTQVKGKSKKGIYWSSTSVLMFSNEILLKLVIENFVLWLIYKILNQQLTSYLTVK